ncbi:paraquat-inducible protein A [Pseudovibrio ascidiaceicola]|jgi:paraquat-inducible protein A|uniref:Paraquat-inducible protein A n=1 Tax=Pseudovibrio ascidiaceicola TaxID=285279 RepID=A0A1I4AR07_9HYPH|nr:MULTISPECIES: paraquat-inducible protein A [Pseudovibrio]KZK98335.1 Paraquat-inducible protein A [Pseudovibrio sp. Ad26]SFK58076.1 paraquat-inducible protein A [Pseudovibrio ascidiaceicola]
MPVLLGFLIPIAAFSFGLGLTLPLLSMERLYFLEDTPSLLQVIGGLYDEGEVSIAGLVFLFSVFLPALKILVLGISALHRSTSKWLRALSYLGKWSMMDVMLVALVIFAAKTSGLASAQVLPGLWFYAAATLSTAVAAFMVGRVAR